MEDFSLIHWCLEHLNYWTIFILMTIESSFIPFPSEVVVPPAAYLVAQGKLNGTMVIISSLGGSLFGAIINYYLALFLGRPLVHKFAESKVGHMLLLSKRKVEHAELYFDKHGAVSTFVGRLIPGIRQLISLPAGLAKMKMPIFLLFTTLGAGIWIVVLYLLGLWAAQIPGINTTDKLVALVSEYSHIIGWSIFGIVALLLVLWWIRRSLRKSKTSC